MAKSKRLAGAIMCRRTSPEYRDSDTLSMTEASQRATESGATEPGATEPGVTEPGATEPRTTEPRTTELPLKGPCWYAQLCAYLSVEEELPLAGMREKCHAFSKAIRKTAKSDDVCVMSVLLTRVIETFDDWTVESRLNESSFVNQHLSPTIKIVFSRHFGLYSRYGETRIETQ
ncbi:hypothetical protein BCR43DRAFT_500125 [Syncephalastrum racemosum]|uniref:Uncharacterized protein n=1 Tax=Syncephalastrum racemosum TaxID=13706 RepID=A0A1X2GZ81_SYNRA|nr:hypothetical protein BCR43DRAFT_500118 [Syncephalastrum racemosum]ORY89240.1 hypothetical protein BCR43DRAFT_500125 [Syncephalastrum racemosum]